MTKKITHADLVKAAAKWLRRHHSIVLTEMSSVREEPDAIGYSHGHSVVVECKTSRADFLADRNKRALKLFTGMGTLRYYLLPAGVINQYEVPDGYGLLIYKDKRSHPELKVNAKPFTDRRRIDEELKLLCSAIRRLGYVGERVKGISVKFYVYDSKCRATLGVLDDKST